MRISDWSSDVCSSDLPLLGQRPGVPPRAGRMTPGPEAQHLPDRSLAATSADGSCSCVPPLVKPADRLTDLRTMIGEEVEPVVSLPHLLRLCRDEHRVLWEHHADPRCRTLVKALGDQVGAALPEPGLMSNIPGPARRALDDARGTA